MIKSYLLSFLIFVSYSGVALSEDFDSENLFISNTRASALVISGTTGFVVPMTHSSLVQAQQLRQFQAQAASGVELSLESRRAEYLASSLDQRKFISEQLGDAAARQYAKRLGYQPLFQGNPGQGRGFDQVYQFGKQVVVIEAKGGSSRPAIYYGHRQGTAPYTLEVAKRTLSDTKSSVAAKQAADAVLKAHQKGNLVIQVSSTPHVYGDPKPTTVQTTYGQLDIPGPVKIAHRTSVRIGLTGMGIEGGVDLVSQLVSGQPVDWKQVGTMTLLGRASSYAGTFFEGITTQQILLKVAPKTVSVALSSLSGGLIAGAVFSYGAYFTGYSTLEQANQSMVMDFATTISVGAVATPLAIAGLTSLAGTLGVTASTGTAIASLSGAAATNATLAWLGGGTLASGGAGVAGGTALVATGIGAIIVVGTVVSGGIFYLMDQEADRKRVTYLLGRVKNHLEQPS